ncbi:MAG: response regulator [Planctomycetes bacterium]|nr:response regulator [Planctomycetota bacterium]
MTAAAANILVADDDTGFRTSLSSILRDQGLSVFEASTAMEAVEVVREEPVNFSVLDVHMPGGTGLEAYKLIVSIRYIPVIFVTGDIDQHIVNEARHLGALMVLEKPPNIALMFELLNRAMWMLEANLRMIEQLDVTDLFSWE